MRIYSVRFNKYDSNGFVNECKTVSRKIEGVREVVRTGKHGDLLVPEFDLQRYESFGEGYESVKIIGSLDDNYFLGKNTLA